MSFNHRKKISVSLLVPFLVFALFFSIMIWKKYNSSRDVPVITSQQNTEGNRSVILFFAADGTRLAREARDIEPCENDSACLKSILDELLNGPIGELGETLPEGTTVDGLRIEGDTATIDFNRTFFEAMLPGSSSEMLAVYSVVNTVATNFSQIQKIKINIDGHAVAALHHLDLSDPLPPDYSLEQIQRQDSGNKPSGTATKDKGKVQ